MFGSHLSIAGGMVNALTLARELKLDTVQVFTKNQQQWRVPDLKPDARDAWLTELAGLGWQDRTVSHASYLINLASPDDELWAKSIDLMQVELERCHELSIPFLVHHPGAFTTSTRAEGLERIAKAYKTLFERTAELTVVSCLEDTVGSGSNLGRELSELETLAEMIVDQTGRPDRVGFCLDTCHLHAGGYDLSTRAGGDAVLKEVGERLGFDRVRVWHLNDSKGDAGSRKDRHDHIGAGTIGRGTTTASLADSGFAAVVNHPAFATTPKILETPKESTKAGTAMDTINLRRLKRLIEL